MKKILIVEDDPVAGTVYRRFLEGNGFVVTVATDGAQGLERLVELEPDAVVLDLMLPKIAGIDVLKAIRADERFRELPVIVMTNACVPAFIMQAVQAGANQVMDKSKDTPTEVLGMLQNLLEGRPQHA